MTFAGRLRRVWLAALAPLWAYGSHGAAIDVEAGLGGRAIPGKWLPVSVVIETQPTTGSANASKSFAGNIEVPVPSTLPTMNLGVHRRPVSLSPNDRQRHWLYIQSETALSHLDVKLVAENGRVEAAVSPKIDRMDSGAPLIVVLSGAGERMELKVPQDMPEPVLVRVDPIRAPDEWYGYDAASLVVIPRATRDMLTPVQVEALRSWVLQGGCLMVCGGRYAESLTELGIDEALPALTGQRLRYQVTTESVSRIDESQAAGQSGSALEVTVVSPAETDDVLMSLPDGVPLITRRAMGGGTLLFLASDWSRHAAEVLGYARALPVYLVTKPDFDRLRRNFTARMLPTQPDALGLGEAARLPSVWLPGLLLLAYFVVVGPLNFFILARKRRLEWAWISIPLIVAAFSGVIYLLSSQIKGRDTVMRRFHLLTGRADAEGVREDSVGMLWLASPQTLTISGRKGAAQGLPQDVDPSGWGGPWGGGYYPYQRYGRDPSQTVQCDTVQTPEGMAISSLALPQWSTDYVARQRIQQMPGKLDAKFRIEVGHLLGELHNQTGWDLSDLSLHMVGRTFHLPTAPADSGTTGMVSRLAAGQSASINLPLHSEIGMEGALVSWDSAGGSTGAAVQAFLQLFTAADQRSLHLPPCVVLAVAQRPSDDEWNVSAAFTATSDLTFLALEAPLSLVDNSTTIAASPPGAAISIDLSQYFGRSELFEISLNNRPAIIAFDFPDRRAAGENLRMTVGSAQYGDSELALIGEVYDHGAGQWTALPMAKRGGPQTENPGMGRNSTRFDFAVEPTAGRWHPWLDTMLFRLRRQPGPAPQMHSYGGAVVTMPGIGPAPREETP